MGMRLLLPLVLLLAGSCAGASGLVQAVRQAAASADFSAAERVLAAYKSQNGITPEYLEAHSWLGRGAQSAKLWDRAEAYASETRQMTLAALKKQPIDSESSLPIALGASTEVRAHTLANTGRLSEALVFLNQELKTYKDSSIRTRIQKNIHLLSLVGKTAPALELSRFLSGPRIASLADLKGKPVLLFFWAHWCADCKMQGPVLASLKKQYPALQIVAPTQRYGYVAGGEEAMPEQEVPYIEQVRKNYYPDLLSVPNPLSEENFRRYGSSTSPTLVFIDADGIVRLYHPGKMTAAELTPVLDRYARAI